jgi:mono/diheme cytochrome c family protein
MAIEPAPGSRPRTARHYVAIGALALLAVLLLIQLVPYGRDHTNPRPTKQVVLATAAQREIFRTACQDCHSYQTTWLWYSNVAPISWLVQSDVDGGRERLNLSTWDRPQAELGDVVEAIQGGDMPPAKYWISPYHWNAKLSDADKRKLIAGFRALYASDPPRMGGGG